MERSGTDWLLGAGPAERLLEDSWEARLERASHRELVAELVAAAMFVAATGVLLALPGATEGFDPGRAVLLVVLYALIARIEFPVGAGYVVPTQLILVPMLVLLPPATVPLLAAAALAAGALWDWSRGRGRPERVVFSVADAWHAVGPAALLVAVGSPHLGFNDLPLLAAAFAAGCVFDLVSATLREAAAAGIAPQLQFRVIAGVWVVDACLAPLGFIAAMGAEHNRGALLLVLPLGALLLLLARDRSARIQQAHGRLELVRRERNRLRAAVGRLGDAFAAKLDLEALLDILLRGSVEALDAGAGRLELTGPEERRELECSPSGELGPALRAATEPAAGSRAPAQLKRGGAWVLTLPFEVVRGSHRTWGVLSLAREDRRFESDEVALVTELIDKAKSAVADILSHEALRVQAMSDALTGLGNRRKLEADLGGSWQPPDATEAPSLLMLFDLDGFKHYNDTFGHLAGDALLVRLGAKLAEAVASCGEAYRLGGDEFCALVTVDADDVDDVIASAADALTEHGDEFQIGASYGAVVVPHEASTPEHALQLADDRMYAGKSERSPAERDETRDVLMRTMQAKQPDLDEHASEVASLAERIAQRLGMSGAQLDEIRRAAELHDVGKVGIPDAILDKPASLDAEEWDFVHQHTILGERILSASPALRPVARIVRSTHERWDGDGYPDRLRGEQIPLGARIVAVCDAYEAMTSDRSYRRAVGAAAALWELRANAGTQFDPKVVDAFLGEIATPRNGDSPVSQDHRELAAHVRKLLAVDAASAAPAASNGKADEKRTAALSGPRIAA